MRGDIEADANDLFDFLVTDGNEHLREQTAAIVDAVEKITPDQITQWREEVLPGVLAQAEIGFVRTFLKRQVHVNGFMFVRVIGCALRRFKRENHKWVQLP